eukprot:scaffold45935_cov24-Tisochrysis_lutea.AAC.1
MARASRDSRACFATAPSVVAEHLRLRAQRSTASESSERRECTRYNASTRESGLGHACASAASSPTPAGAAGETKLTRLVPECQRLRLPPMISAKLASMSARADTSECNSSGHESRVVPATSFPSSAPLRSVPVCPVCSSGKRVSTTSGLANACTANSNGSRSTPTTLSLLGGSEPRCISANSTTGAAYATPSAPVFVAAPTALAALVSHVGKRRRSSRSVENGERSASNEWTACCGARMGAQRGPRNAHSPAHSVRTAVPCDTHCEQLGARWEPQSTSATIGERPHWLTVVLSIQL